MASGAANEAKVAADEEKAEEVVLRMDAPWKEGPIMKIRNVHKTYLLGIGAFATPSPLEPRHRGRFLALFG